MSSNSTDLYGVIGLTKTATIPEIKKAIKELKKKWHPDNNPNNQEEASKKFKEITKAETILLNPDKKKIYDDGGEQALQQQQQQQQEGGFNPFEDMMRNVMGIQTNENVPDLELPLELTLDQLYNGVMVEKSIERGELCDQCNGKGTRDGKEHPCKQCKGQGMMMIQHGPQIFQTQCNKCQGDGIDPQIGKCKKCNGTSCYHSRTTVSVNVPAGSYNGYQIRLSEQGHAIPQNESNRQRKVRSDIVFIVQEKEHSVFKRGVTVNEKKGVDVADLLINMKVSFVDSLIGFSNTVKHLDGTKFEIHQTDPVRHGDILVIKNYGMPRVDDGTHKKGDLFVKLTVDYPNKNELNKKKIYHLFTGKDDYKELEKTPNVNVPRPDITSFDEYSQEVKRQVEAEEARQRYKNRGQPQMAFRMGGGQQCQTQ